jgi:ethanolamine utilization protein EutN
MIIGKVVGSIWCTRKDERLTGLKFMRVKTMDREDEEDGRIIVAVDLIGAGIDETVLMTNGSSARRLDGLDQSPVDCIIVGIIDGKE